MVVGEMAADEVLLDLLAVGDVKDEVGAVAVQEVNGEVFGPFVFAKLCQFVRFKLESQTLRTFT